MNTHGGTRPGAGRPAGATSNVKLGLADKASGYADMAIEALVDVCQNSDSDAARVSAANAILDRGYGKPPQAIQHTGSIQNMSDDEINTRIEEITQSLGYVKIEDRE